jgi:hypothetical protein
MKSLYGRRFKKGDHVVESNELVHLVQASEDDMFYPRVVCNMSVHDQIDDPYEIHAGGMMQPVEKTDAPVTCLKCVLHA